jgi:HEAT repeat protein
MVDTHFSRQAAVAALLFLAPTLVPTLTEAQGQPPRAPRPARPAPTAEPTPAPRPVLAPRPARSWSDFEWEMERAGAEMARAGEEIARSMAGFKLDRAAIADMAAQTARLSAEGAAMAVAAAPIAEIAHGVAASVSASVAPMALGFAQDLADGFAYSYSTGSRGYRTETPAPWAQDDPADSLYREARKALSGDAYRKAADLFRSIRERYPKSSYAPDAPYWEAFALQRLGGEANLRAAREALALQQREYPKAATRGDATALGTRIDGQLGRNDSRVATTLRGRADQVASDGCPNSKDDERVDALNAVMQMDPEQAMPILKKVLARREPCTQQLRRTAVWLVASRKQPEAASILINVAKSDPDKEVREQAVFWLANVPTDEAVSMLIGLAKTGEDTDLRKRAVYALSRSKSEKAMSTLREIALDTKAGDEVRSEAMNYYMRTDAGKAEGTAFLKDAFSRTESTRYRMQMLGLIASRRTDDSRNFLINVALDEREAMDIRRNAVSMLPVTTVRVTMSGQHASNVTSANSEAADASTKAIVQVYDRATDLELKRSALGALASSRSTASIDKLLDIARNEKNPELRKYAVSTLSRTKDPRALALLQEIIDR